MQTALHIGSLVRQLEKEIVGGKIVATEFYKKERATYFFIKKEKERSALGFVYHPAGSGVFLIPASKVKIETREKPWPIFALDGARIETVEQFGFDRIFELHCLQDGKKQTLAIEAIGPNGNLWLLDKDNGRQATLRKRDFVKGEPYKNDPPDDRAPIIDQTASSLQALFDSFDSDFDIAFALDKKLLGANRTIINEIVHRADLTGATVGDTTLANCSALTQSIADIVGLFDSAETGYLYQMRKGIEVYPFKLSSVERTPEKYKTLSLAVQAMTQMRQAKVEDADETKTILDTLKRSIKRLERRHKNIENDLAGAADFENYKKFGELIQINMAQIQKGMTEIELDDIYSGGNITIALEPSITPAENAEAFFKKYRKGREGLETLQRRLEITEQELKQAEKIYSELDSNFNSARERYAAEIASMLPREGVKSDSAVRLPYREYQLSTGVTIFVGRDGSDNDRTTFEFARPYELWFHTQQCPGSHVVIKFPNKSFEPSKREIEETAAIAAYYSKARNDSLVPVIYTQRRYVRKPRKAKAGLVTVEREKSVMVEPQPPHDRE